MFYVVDDIWEGRLVLRTTHTRDTRDTKDIWKGRPVSRTTDVRVTSRHLTCRPLPRVDSSYVNRITV